MHQTSSSSKQYSVNSDSSSYRKGLKSFRTFQAEIRNERLIDLVSLSISKINHELESDDLPDFVETLLRVSGTNEAVVIVSLIFMNRLIDVNSVSEYGRMIYLVCLVIATKVLIEPGFTNGAWARLLKLETNEINLIESMILDRLSYNTHVSMQQFWKYKKSIVEYQYKKKTG